VAAIEAKSTSELTMMAGFYLSALKLPGDFTCLPRYFPSSGAVFAVQVRAWWGTLS